jgi:hypothetical protein
MSDQRKPLFDDVSLKSQRDKFGNPYPASGEQVRDFYEAKITIGELRVVNQVEIRSDNTCSGCEGWLSIEDDHGQDVEVGFEFCPHCGEKIKR